MIITTAGPKRRVSEGETSRKEILSSDSPALEGAALGGHELPPQGG